jgi:hypothetical protein
MWTAEMGRNMPCSSRRRSLVNEHLNAALAREHIADLRHAAESERRVAQARAAEDDGGRTSTVELRAGRFDDRRSLQDLTNAAHQSPLSGPLLVATLDGHVVAAVELATQRTVNGPEAEAGGALELLRLRAEQLGGRPRRRRFWRKPLWAS